MRCALCEEGGIGISIFGAENACCPNRYGPNARLTNGCIRTGASQTGMSRTAMSRTARPEWGESPPGLAPSCSLCAPFPGVARASSAHSACLRVASPAADSAPSLTRVRRAHPTASSSGSSRCCSHRKKKFVTARSRCRRNRCVVRLWKEAGRGSASAGTSTDETIRCLNGARRCSVGAKRENHSRAVQSAFQAAFSAMLKTAARPLK